MYMFHVLIGVCMCACVHVCMCDVCVCFDVCIVFVLGECSVFLLSERIV